MTPLIESGKKTSGASTLSRRTIADLFPGLLLAAAITTVAILVRNATGWAALSPLILSIILGVIARRLMPNYPVLNAGIAFSVRRLLRLGIVLLGLQVTLGQVLSLGAGGLTMVAITLVASFFFILLMGRLLRVEAALTNLIAAGTSICGASAVIAANAVVRGRQEHVAYAIACVTLFGCISMFLYPLLLGPLGLDMRAYGLWSGATIHEVAQVVAASFQAGDVAGQFGMISKLARVVLLAPMMMLLVVTMRARAEGSSKVSAPMPWFVFGFMIMMLVNSFIEVPKEIHGSFALTSTFLLSMALGAMGYQIDIRKVRDEGWRPLALAALGWIFITIFGYGMLKLFQL
ncbi:hypothetical protein D9M69_05280 [compost metagenome]